MKKNLYNLLTTLAALAVAFVTLVGMAAALCAPHGASACILMTWQTGSTFSILIRR